MAVTTFQGPLRSGSIARNTVGSVELIQRITLNANGALEVDGTANFPSGATLINIFVDVLTAFNGTTAPITVGSVAAGTQFVSAISGLVAGRTVPTFTAAQLAAMQSLAYATNSNVATVVASVIPTGANTAGQAVITLVYIQNDVADYA